MPPRKKNPNPTEMCRLCHRHVSTAYLEVHKVRCRANQITQVFQSTYEDDSVCGYCDAQLREDQKETHPLKCLIKRYRCQNCDEWIPVGCDHSECEQREREPQMVANKKKRAKKQKTGRQQKTSSDGTQQDQDITVGTSQQGQREQQEREPRANRTEREGRGSSQPVQVQPEYIPPRPNIFSQSSPSSLNTNIFHPSPSFQPLTGLPSSPLFRSVFRSDWFGTRALDTRPINSLYANTSTHSEYIRGFLQRHADYYADIYQQTLSRIMNRDRQTLQRGLTAQEIGNIKRQKYEKESEDELCPICQIEFVDEEELSILKCQHRYHSQCVNTWLQINCTCPICKRDMREPPSQPLQPEDQQLLT